MASDFSDIPTLEGYKANRLGEVMGCYKKPMSQRPNGDYLYVQVYCNDKNTNLPVHLLIAQTFLENPSNYTFVRHKNEDLHDNKVENLEWCEFLYKRQEGEVFKPIKDWEQYLISNFGNVLSTVFGTLLKVPKPHNYYIVTLKQIINGKPKSSLFVVHELVAAYFIENVNPEYQKLIKHKDGIFLNNKHTNLEWVEQFYVTQPGEIFIDIKGFEQSYKISNFGNILIKELGVLAKLGASGDYYGMKLRYKTKEEHYLVHILVAIHFIPNTDKTKNKVDHIDGNKFNNKFDNLRWCTQSENMKFHADSGNRTYAYKKVIQKNEKGKVIKIWDKLDDVIEENEDYSRSTLLVNLTAERKKGKPTYGYFWEYEIEETILEKDEVFTNIGTFEGNNFSNYECSNYGKIRTIAGKYMAPTIASGYQVIALTYSTNQNISLRVHRIVAHLFVKNENPEKFDVVNHLDKNRLNNYSANLVWTDLTGNTRHAIGKKIQQINLETGEVIKTFDTITDAYKALGKDVVGPHISRTASGKAKSALGFGWKYCT